MSIESKTPAQGRRSAVEACSDSVKHPYSTAISRDTSIASPWVVYFVEHAGLFEWRSVELLGTYDKPQAAIQRLFECAVDLHWRYRPVPSSDDLYRVLERLREGLKRITRDELTAVGYLLPTPFRDEDGAFIGITRLSAEGATDTSNVLMVKSRAGMVQECFLTPSGLIAGYRPEPWTGGRPCSLT